MECVQIIILYSSKFSSCHHIYRLENIDGWRREYIIPLTSQQGKNTRCEVFWCGIQENGQNKQ